jgi:hypothetical protein
MLRCFLRRTGLVAMIGAVSIPGAHAFAFSDGNMFNLLYSRTIYQYGFGGTANTAGSSQGNPGNARYVQLSHNGGGTGVGATHIASQSAITIQPGGIANVNFSLDFRLQSSFSSPVDLAFVIEQAGRRYATFLVPQQGTTSYQTIDALGLNENDFEEIAFDGTLFTDSSQRPDFQLAGSTMRFGFWTSSEGFGSAVHDGLYDNFSVSGTAVPEPAAMAMMGIGLASMLRRRNSRQRP